MNVEGFGVLGFQFVRKEKFDFTENAQKLEKCRKSE